jgi:hypothetical protein
LRISLGRSNETCSARNSADSMSHPLFVGVNWKQIKAKKLIFGKKN